MSKPLKTFFQETLDSAKSKINELKEAGAEKIDDLVDELLLDRPIIQQAGFDITDIQIGLTIPPELTVTLSRHQAVSLERIDELMKEHEDRKLLITILRALHAAEAMQRKISANHFYCNSFSIKLGLPPGIELNYMPDDQAGGVEQE